MSKDPWSGNVWRPGTFNAYVYALNNPLTLVDPSGEMCLLGFSVGPGRDCTGEELERVKQDLAQFGTFIWTLFSTPGFSDGFMLELVDSILIAGPSTAARVLELVLSQTPVKTTLGNCGVTPETLRVLSSPYSSVVNNPDPYFQLGRMVGRAAALVFAGTEIGTGLGGTIGLALSGGGIALTPATLALSAHGAVVVGGVVVKEASDPLLIRWTSIVDDAWEAAGGDGDGTGGGSNSPRPHLNRPKSELPTSGRSYVPPKQKGNPEVVPNPKGKGYIDNKGNIWEWAHDQHGGPHWDVQHPNKSHTNVTPEGRIIGKDNF